VNATDGRLVRARLRQAPATATAVPLFGIAIFTFFLVTSRWSDLFTEFAIGIALLGLLLSPAGFRFPVPLRWGTAFLLWALITTFFAISPETAQAALIERLKALVICLVVMNALRTPQQLRFYILLIIFAYMLYPGRGTLKNFLAGETVQGRAHWNKIYANPNDLAAITLLMLGLTLAVATVKTQNRRVRVAAAACVPVMLLIILLTQSRGVFIGLIVGFAPPLLAKIRARPSIVVPVLIVLSGVAALVPGSSWHRLEGISKLTSLETIREADKVGSAEERLQITKIAWQIFTDHPVLGVGIGCYNEANARYAPQLGLRDAHNTYLSLAAEVGVPGLLLWLGLVGSMLAELRRRRRSVEADNETLQALWIERALIGFLVAGLFGTYSGLTPLYLIFGILWAACQVLGRSGSEPEKPQPRTPVARRRLRAR
jgi:O-antigen ligase